MVEIRISETIIENMYFKMYFKNKCKIINIFSP